MLDVLYSDNHLLAVNKPAGLLTQPSGTDQDSLEARAKAWIKESCGKAGGVFLEAVHRLDRPVAGVVLFGRTSKAVSRLNASARAGEFVKLYLAMVSQAPPAPQGRLEHWLCHDDFCAKVVNPSVPGAKQAILDYETLEETRQGIVLQIRLHSGRYHQIRAQLSHIGCPIVGDARYGSRIPWKPETIALQHHQLAFSHPVTHQPLRIIAPRLF